MNKNCTIKAPFFEIGPKSYLYGDEILDLAKAADRAAMVDEMIAAVRKAWDERHA